MELQGRHDEFIPAGTRVRYDGLEDGGPEYGVVVHCWYEEEIGGFDCYIAFFGTSPAMGKPQEKPYILRYAAISLVRMNDREA